MQAQRPAEGIMQTGSYRDAESYHIECDCHSADHAVRMWIEVDEDTDTQDVQVGFYVDTWTPFWDSKFSRIRTAWNVLVHGLNRQEHHLILNKQAALNFSTTIEGAVRRLDSKRK